MPAVRTLHPASAVTWLAPACPARVLDLGDSSGALAHDLGERGHEVYAVAPGVADARRVQARAVVRAVVDADPSRLPFRPRWFDVVTLACTELPARVLPEAARVLRPGGHLGVVTTCRDDTVPWVRRLAGLLQTHDPRAMTETRSGPSIEDLLADGWFVDAEEHRFRLWVPTDRAGLLAMVENRPAVAELAPDRHANLLADVGMLFDDIARGREVMLPYSVICRRAWPDPDRQQAEPSVVLGPHLHW